MNDNDFRDVAAALRAFQVENQAKAAAYEASREAWAAHVTEAIANGAATQDKPSPAITQEVIPLPRTHAEIVDASRHAARVEAAAGGSQIDQYALAMEAAQRAAQPEGRTPSLAEMRAASDRKAAEERQRAEVLGATNPAPYAGRNL